MMTAEVLSGPVLVVGGCGFVGAHLVRALLDRGTAVRVFDVAPFPDERVESLVGDLRQREAVAHACAGVTTVFQSASRVDWSPGAQQAVYDINVLGNQHVIDACQQHGVARLIYTSSIDVVFDGTPIDGGDETLPYPRRHLDTYGATKAVAEQAVLAADGRDGLATCALRLAGVYGPGDRHRLPAIFAVARRGAVPRLGAGRARFNHVYVENVVHAHMLAAQSLRLDSPVAGQPYFITDHPPSNFYRFFEPFLQPFGYRLARRSIPYRVAYTLALVMEAAYRVRPQPQPPLLTRYVVASTCVDFWFTHARASRDFGYTPVVSQAEAYARTLAWLRAEEGEGARGHST